MKITFETEFGRIECIRYDDGGGNAYFYRDDLGSEISKEGIFTHIFTGIKYQILWPSAFSGKNEEGILEVQTWRTIGRAKP